MDCDHWIEPDRISHLTEVLTTCRQKKIGIALSNPCFELWRLLHFADFPEQTNLSCEEITKQLQTVCQWGDGCGG